ncbi:MAG: hypothetical protein ACOVLE_10785, partial [Pirellula staleyi]
ACYFLTANGTAERACYFLTANGTAERACYFLSRTARRSVPVAFVGCVKAIAFSNPTGGG